MSEQNTEIVVLDFNPEVIDPKKETLLAIADEVSKITADPSKMDKDTLELVNTTKNKLVKARTTIEKACKALRDPHTAYNKAVAAYEDELIAIIEPQEKRLKELEVTAKAVAIRIERMKHLPDYKQQLASIGDLVEVTDDELLGMDPTAFQAYYNTRLGAHLQARQAEADAAIEAARLAKEAGEKALVEAKQALLDSRVTELYQLGILEPGARPIILTLDGEIEVTKEMLQDYSPEMFEQAKTLWNRLTQEYADSKAKELAAKQEAEVKAAAEKARLEAEAKAKQDADLKEAKRLQDEAAAKEKQEAEERAKQAAIQLQQENEKFQKWLVSNSYNKETDMLIEEVGQTKMYRFVSEYKH